MFLKENVAEIVKRMVINKRLVVLTVFWITALQVYLLHTTWTRRQQITYRRLDSAINGTKIIAGSNVLANQNDFKTKQNIDVNSGNISDKNYIEFFAKDRSKIQRIVIDYGTFQLPEPNFISESDKILFHKNKGNEEMGQIQNATNRVRGEIYNIRNGTFKLPYDCGYRSDFKYITEKRDVPKNKWYFTISPLIIPDGHTFQHFIDGTLPKIIQIIDYLQKPFVKLLMMKPRDKIVYEMLDKLNISRQNIVLFTHGTIGADNLLFTCNTPPLHPALWSKARKLLGVHEERTTSWNDSKVILLTRQGSFNGGRNILNFQETIDTLTSKYGKSHVSVFSGPYTLSKSIEMFGKAKIIIGVHGGGLYNMLFCPKGTVVVEIMPTRDSGIMAAAADKIFWAQAYLLGHKYWRFPLPPQKRGNVIVDVAKLRRILDKIDYHSKS